MASGDRAGVHAPFGHSGAKFAGGEISRGEWSTASATEFQQP
jgi:hypothetical protein